MINDSEGYYYYYVVNEKLAARGFGLRYAINFCLHLMKKISPVFPPIFILY